MARRQQETVVCSICHKHVNSKDAWPGEMVRPAIAEAIRKRYPEWSSSEFICRADLELLRTEYVQDVLEQDEGEISALQEEVVRSLAEQEVLSRNLNVEFDRELTLAERVADRVAEFGGSWRFIFTFGGVLLLWIVINSVALFRWPFDPFPFILLNLVLSCLAAIQAPVIMMSQNRQEARDRLRSEHDYRTNLKAELEIRHLDEKMDLLLTHQWQRLLEIQQVQMDLMEELVEKKNGGGSR